MTEIMAGAHLTRATRARSFLFLCSVLISGVAAAQQPAMPPEYRDVLADLGLTGDYSDGVLKITLMRPDLSVSVAGRRAPAAFGFSGWLAFAKGDRNVDVMMGDLVLLEEEVNPVISALLANGLEVTALHNHFLFEDPRVMYMHIHGMGDAGSLASDVKPALDLIGRVRRPDAPPPRPALPLLRGNLNADRLNRIIGTTGTIIPPVYKVVVPRTDIEVRDMGALINARMGLNSWLAVFGSDDTAAVAGDIAMLEEEVTPVVKALRANDVEVAAIHHHMTGTRPVIIFLHYWGIGPAEGLAKGFRAALDELGSHRP
ncbi:MAG: DUF1259 domain-containing protein [Bacteroidota bacterium]